jgi:hypothetical protein
VVPAHVGDHLEAIGEDLADGRLAADAALISFISAGVGPAATVGVVMIALLVTGASDA